jgi:hypothetical protein
MLRQQVTRFEESGQAYKALKRLYILYADLEKDQRFRKDARPKRLAGQIAIQRQAAKRDLIIRLQEGFSSRQTMVDLELIRKAKALDPSDVHLQKQYQRMVDNFRFYLAPTQARGSVLKPDLKYLKTLLKREKLELVIPVENRDRRCNSRLAIFVGKPVWMDTGWVMVRRKPFYRWVPRRDRRGRKVLASVKVCHKTYQVDGSSKQECHVETKVVYDRIYGEFRFFERKLGVTVPWRASIDHLGRRTKDLSIARQASTQAVSRFFVYKGDRRGYVRPAGWPDGRRNAQFLPRRELLLQDVLRRVDTQLVRGIKRFMEK